MSGDVVLCGDRCADGHERLGCENAAVTLVFEPGVDGAVRVRPVCATHALMLEEVGG